MRNHYWRIRRRTLLMKLASQRRRQNLLRNGLDVTYWVAKPRGRMVKVFCGSSRDPNSNPHHTRFLQRVAIEAFTFSLRRMVYHFFIGLLIYFLGTALFHISFEPKFSFSASL